MIRRKLFRLKLSSRTLVLGERTLVMGVLNVTPDSFSDGGKFLQPESAIEHAFAMERAGADLLDIGGESTRPGSVETRRASVAELAIRAGAELVNDVSGLRSDPRIAEAAARHRVPLILMHMRGEPRTMQAGEFARDVLKDVIQGLRKSVAVARRAGVGKSQIIVDPGIGFGKSFAQNYELLQKLPQLAKLGYLL